MELTTERAKAAYAFSPIKKESMSPEVFEELVNDFAKRHNNLTIDRTLKNPEPFGWNVFVDVDAEGMQLYEDWRVNFTRHGYEPPFLTVNVRGAING